jgi:hypothetical protein
MKHASLASAVSEWRKKAKATDADREDGRSFPKD